MTRTPLPHISDMTDEELIAVAADCEYMIELYNGVRGSNKVIRNRLNELDSRVKLKSFSEIGI